MPTPTSKRSDLVLGLSLAEAFLLLIFAVLLVSAGTPGVDPNLEIRRLKDELAKLEGRLATLKAERDHLLAENEEQKLIIEQLKKMAGTLGYRPAELKDPEKFKEFVEALRRGHPKCNRDDNLAIQVVADRGLISVTVLSDQFLRELSSEIPSSLKPRVLTALAAIDQFLHAVKQHEDAAAPPCRYDYRLYYRTSDDYHFAREKFERPYFYPERMIPLAR